MEHPRCICGQEVAVPHKECMGLLTDEEEREFRATGRAVRTRGVLDVLTTEKP